MDNLELLAPIKDKSFMYQTLAKVKRLKEDVICWRLVMGQKSTSEMRLVDISQYHNKMKLVPLDGQLENVREIISSYQYVNFYLLGQSLLFQCKIEEFDESGTLIISFPKEMVQIDRRTSPRLNITNSINCKMIFQKHGSHLGSTQLFEKDLLDISSGGASFMTTKIEGQFFKQGESIEKIKLLVENQPILVKAKIINVVQVNPNSNANITYGGKKICLQFDGLKPEVVSFLQKFVFKHYQVDEKFA